MSSNVTLYEKQIAIEQEAISIKRAKYIREMLKAFEHGRASDTAEGRMLMKLGFFQLRHSITRYMNTPRKGQQEKVRRYLLLLTDDPDEVTFVILRTIVDKLISTGSNRVTAVSRRLVSMLGKLRLFRRLKEEHPRLHSYLGQKYYRASTTRKREIVEKKVKELLSDTKEISTQGEEVRLGTALLEVTMLSGVNLIELVDTFDNVSMKKHKELHFTNEAQESIKEYSLYMSSLVYPTFKPMIVRPRDWTEFYKGGLLSFSFPFIKVKMHKRWYKEQDYSLIYPPINKLQSMEWRINKKIVDLISTIFNNDIIDPSSPSNLPKLYGGLPTSTVYSPEDLLKMKYKIEGTLDYSTYKDELIDTQLNLAGEVSRRLVLILSLSIAKEYMEYDAIYFPYQLDYRGRVYPITAHLTPQGPAYIKSMLEFGQGEYLDETGKYWLKIHIANCYGRDKEEFDDRIRWFAENEVAILKAARDPMGYIKVWNRADSPYEFLAGCMAWDDYIQGKKVYLPIQLDATNSGLQFYSGALGDREGGQLVNIINKEEDGKIIRADVYQNVADAVYDWVASSDCLTEIPFKASDGKMELVDTAQERKDLLNHGITRKMVKRNVMTIPYSVSLRGMSKQNREILDDMELKGKNFWKGEKWVVNRLITEGVNRMAGELLQGAKLGQEYLKKAVRHLEVPASWYTPIFNFPVKQQTLERKEHRVKTALGTLTIYIDGDKVNKKRQSSSIAPNFIHSLDATVLLSVITLAEDYDVGVIHDCFLVSPNNGNKVRDAYRESFISLMMYKPLEHFSRQIDPMGLVEVPYIGTMDLVEVADAKYIIS